jgi:hypothetical protein
MKGFQQPPAANRRSRASLSRDVGPMNMSGWLTMQSPRWLTQLGYILFATCFAAVFLSPLMGATVGAALLVCWLLVHGTSCMSPRARRRVIVAYATLHLGAWAVMHALVSVPFHARILLMHQEAAAAAPLELARYRQRVVHPDPAFEKHIMGRVNPKPRARVLSLSPVPLVLITHEGYQIGPLSGLGMTHVYTLTLSGVRMLFEDMRWIS